MNVDCGGSMCSVFHYKFSSNKIAHLILITQFFRYIVHLRSLIASYTGKTTHKQRRLCHISSMMLRKKRTFCKYHRNKSNFKAHGCIQWIQQIKLKMMVSIKCTWHIRLPQIRSLFTFFSFSLEFNSCSFFMLLSAEVWTSISALAFRFGVCLALWFLSENSWSSALFESSECNSTT